MFNINIESKELKGIMEKVLVVAPKKSSCSILESILLENVNGQLKATSTDLDQFLIVISDRYESIEDGKILLDIDDVKMINKMNGFINLAEKEDYKVSVKVGKKVLSMQNKDVLAYIDIPSESSVSLIDMTESYLADALQNMYSMTSQSDNNKIMQCYNFNLLNNRIEVLDGHRIALKTLSSQKVYDTSITNLLLLNMANNSLKKVLDKKSDNLISISLTDKYIILSGTDFKYYQRKTDGEFFKINNMLTDDYDFEFKCKVNDLLEISKYDYDIVKEEKKPFMFSSIDGSLYTYAKTNRYESLNQLETSFNSMKNDYYIAFNPMFIKDAMTILKSEYTDNVSITGNGRKAPIMVYGNEYTFLILPVNVTDDDFNNMKNCIEKNK